MSSFSPPDPINHDDLPRLRRVSLSGMWPMTPAIPRMLFWVLVIAISCILPASYTYAQTSGSDSAPSFISPLASNVMQAPPPADLQSMNPVSMLDTAAHAIPGFQGGLSTTLNLLILLTVLTIAPSILIMCTCFTRFVIVLSLLRQAVGTAQLPPSQIIVGLSMFMTFLVMQPTFTRIYQEAIVPYQQGDPHVQSQLDVWNRAKEPLRQFMFAQIDANGNWDSVYTIMRYRGFDVSHPERLTLGDVDMVTLVPAYIISELKVAFLIGFRIYLPFLIIDMVISSLLISMGMLMLPPVLISMPFKLLLFVLVDGWTLIVGNLLIGYAQPAASPTTAVSLLMFHEHVRPLLLARLHALCC